MVTIKEVFVNFGTTITQLMQDPNVILGFMFLAMFVGSFAMYKGLLRFAFADKGQFQHKERNVIAFMISVISTTGIFWIFRNTPSVMISLFGGFAGLFLVIFLVIFLMYFILSFAKEFKDEEGFLKLGQVYLFILSIGVLLSSYLLLGYSLQVIESLSGASPVLWSKIYNFWATIAQWALIAAVLFGIFALIKLASGNSKEELDEKIFGKEDSALRNLFKKKKSRTEEEESQIKKIQGVTKRMAENLETINKRAEEQQKLMVDLNNILNLSKKQSKGGQP